MTSIKKHSAAVLTATILAAAPPLPTLAAEVSAESIRVSSYKGSTLEVGERQWSHHRPQWYGLHRHLQ